MTRPRRTPGHPCARPGCDHNVRTTSYACYGCWMNLPRDIRTAITNAWIAGGRTARAVLSPTYREAAAAALAHWKTTDDKTQS